MQGVDKGEGLAQIADHQATACRKSSEENQMQEQDVFKNVLKEDGKC